MTEKEYLSYKTINVFIERDYLEHILEMVLKEKDKLSKEDQIAFINAFKHHINVLGFRNSTRAPLSMQLNAYVSAFEEKNEVVPFTLSTWVKLNQDLAQIVKDWLNSKGWDNLALERIFDETEGFINEWPENLTFDDLVKEFKKANPDIDFERDDLILMVLWISGKLPSEQTNI